MMAVAAAAALGASALGAVGGSAQALSNPAIPQLTLDRTITSQPWLGSTGSATKALDLEGAAYVPLEVRGPHAAAIVAFARVAKDGGAAVAVVCRWPRVGWADTSVVLPSGRFASCFDAQGGLSGTVPVVTLFARLPVALLASEPKR